MTDLVSRMVARLLLRMVGVTGVLVSLCFMMVEYLPGDIAFQVAAARYDVENVTPDVEAAVERELGLDQPAGFRFGQWLCALAKGDLGRSVVTHQPVASMLEAPLRRSLLLVALTLPLSVAFGLPLGLWLGRTPTGLTVAKLLGALASGAPTYVLGLLLVLIVSIKLKVLPSAGFGGAAFLILPAATLALRGMVRIALLTAVCIADALQHPSIAFARMKGLGEASVMLQHALPLTSATIVAFVFATLAAQLEGAAVVEQLFAYPGLGKLLVDAVLARDVPVVQASAIVMAMLIVACNTMGEASVWLFDRRTQT